MHNLSSSETLTMGLSNFFWYEKDSEQNQTTPTKTPLQSKSFHFHLTVPLLPQHLHFNPLSPAEPSCQLMSLQLPAGGTEEDMEPRVPHAMCVALSK